MVPVYGTLIDAGCLALLWRLTRREGIRLPDLVGFERTRLVRDALLGLALVPAILAFILGGVYAAGWLLYGTFTPPYLLGGLPLPAAVYGVLVWPFIWGLTEQMTYNGYLLPRFQVLCRSTGVAIAIVAFVWSLQHVVMPLTSDARFMAFRLLSPVPQSVFATYLYLRLRRVLPLAVAHALLDGATVLIPMVVPLLRHETALPSGPHGGKGRAVLRRGLTPQLSCGHSTTSAAQRLPQRGRRLQRLVGQRVVRPPRLRWSVPARRVSRGSDLLRAGSRPLAVRRLPLDPKDALIDVDRAEHPTRSVEHAQRRTCGRKHKREQVQSDVPVDHDAGILQPPAQRRPAGPVLQSSVWAYAQRVSQGTRPVPEPVRAGQHQAAARAEDADQVVNRRPRGGRVLDTLGGHDHVEGVVGERTPGHVGGDDVADALPPRDFQQVDAEVQRYDGRAAGEGDLAEVSSPATGVQHAQPCQIDIPEQLIEDDLEATPEVVRIHDLVEARGYAVVEPFLVGRHVDPLAPERAEPGHAEPARDPTSSPVGRTS